MEIINKNKINSASPVKERQTKFSIIKMKRQITQMKMSE